MPFTELANSTFLDFDSYRSTASVPGNGTPLASFAFNVALVLDRANDPTALLAESWGARQHDLKVLNDNGTLWSTYGANQANYNHVLADLASLGIRPSTRSIPPTATCRRRPRARSGSGSMRATSPPCSDRPPR